VSEIKSAKQQGYFLIALALLCAALLFYGLGRLPLIGPDEPRYAEVAREMFVSGDWITPRLGGIHWFEKPALTYWLAAAGYALFGVSEWATRFLIALVACASALLLYFFGRRVWSARYGYLSAAALLSGGIWLGFGRAATFDTPLAATMTLALVVFYLWDREQKNFWRYLCAFALGLAVLAKGLAGIVLPGAIILLYLIFTRRLVNLLKRPGLLFVGAIIFLAVTATWYAPMFARHGREFRDEFFLAHHFQRYLTNKYQHPQPWYFFSAIALMGSLPWSCHLLTAAVNALRRWRVFAAAKAMTEADRRQLFLWLWALVPIVFFSFSGSKLPGYILPVFPAIALLIGAELERLWTETSASRVKWMSTVNGLLLVITGVVVWLRGADEIGVSAFQARSAAAIVTLMALVYLALLWSRREKIATLFLPFGVAVIVVASTHLLFDGLGRKESMRELSLVAARAARPGERLIFFINTEQSLNFYATELPLRDQKAAMVTLMKPEEVVALMRAEKLSSLLVISLEKWSGMLAENENLNVERIGQQERADQLVLLRLRLRALSN
jgi:4-amino-4-deoxy-L-arabinose transferase-like glycosyltransferase